MPEPRKEFTTEEARRYGEAIGIDWASARSTSPNSRRG